MKAVLFTIIASLCALCALATTPSCTSVPGTSRLVLLDADMQIVLDGSFELGSPFKVAGKERGVAAWSSVFGAGVLALSIPANDTLSNTEFRFRLALSLLGLRPRSGHPLLFSPVLYHTDTWDKRDSIQAAYGMDTDPAQAERCGVKRRINEMASKLLGATIAALADGTDVFAMPKKGFALSLELVRRGDNIVALFALAPVSDDAAEIEVRAIADGGATAGAKDALLGACETLTAAPMHVDLLFVVDPNPLLYYNRRALGAKLQLLDMLTDAGISWRAAVSYTKDAPVLYTSDISTLSTALKTFVPFSTTLTGSPAAASGVLAVVFVGDTDNFATPADALAHYTALAAGRTLEISLLSCPEGSLCRHWQSDSEVSRKLVSMTGGVIGQIRPVDRFTPALLAILRNIVAAASGVTLSDHPAAETVRIVLPSDSTRGSCNWADVPRSNDNGFLVMGSRIAFFGNCAPAAGTRIAASYAHFSKVIENPCVPEVCDGADNDCDGLIDEDFDLDGDGYTTCDPTSILYDCDDTNAAVHPNAVEDCDTPYDDNCNGAINEGCPGTSGLPFELYPSTTVDCSVGSTTFDVTVYTSPSTILSSLTVPLDAAWALVSSEPPAIRTDTGIVFESPLGEGQHRTFTFVLGGIFASGPVNMTCDGTIPSTLESVGPVELLTFPPAVTQQPAVLTYTATIRDMLPSHPDVEGLIVSEPGLVKTDLGTDGTPELDTSHVLVTVTSAASFATWYHDSAVTQTLTRDISFNRVGPNKFRFADASFFPINYDGFNAGVQNSGKNRYFTLELTTSFRFRGVGEVIAAESDDDLWLFVDGKLAIDLGGVHPRSSKSITVESLGLAVGTDHEIKIFFAERHATDSVLILTLPGSSWNCETADHCGNCTTFCPTGNLDSDGDGVLDCMDVCPHDPSRWDASLPAPCPCGQGDDADGDGTPDCLDLCPADPNKTAPGLCGCGVVEDIGDYDNDGRLNCRDPCPYDPSLHCSCNGNDTDTDGDSWPDCMDGCPFDANKMTPGICGCGVADVDTDGDGAADCIDGCPLDADKTDPGICGCGVSDNLDTDGDGTADCVDGCPNDPGKTDPGVCGCGIADVDTDGDGTLDCNDGCPNDANKVAPGDCGCGEVDTDTDGDGTANCNDECPVDPNKIAPGVCGCGVADVDTDGDGTLDCNDGCPSDASKTAPGVCGCGIADSDTDGDGTLDCMDTCFSDPNKVLPGVCGCGVADADTDGDGTLDCNDNCPNDANKVAPGVCGCGVADVDTDGDGTLDCNDACPNNAAFTSMAGDCGCDPAAYADTDGDGTDDCHDLCPNDAGKTAPGICGCGVADVDTDGDGTLDCNDTCPGDPNKLIPGECGCGIADVDTDGDGTLDCNEDCPNSTIKTSPGQCGCTIPDTDTDGDGTADCNDGCPNDAGKSAPGICGCGVADVDTDGDGTLDCNDTCPADPTKTLPGICGCGVSDADGDGDGTPNCNDECPADPEKTAPGVCGCGVADVDTDGDGTLDCNDDCPNDANKVAPGVCGCGVADVDTDGDGTLDCNDNCPTDPHKIASGACGCGVADTDSDGDGTPDCNDECDGDPDKIAPGVCGCGYPDTDSDLDGTPDCIDNCPTSTIKTDPGVCGCNVPDVDEDGDGYYACEETCDNNPNMQEPGVCGCFDAIDTDGDGTPDCIEVCDTDPNKQWPGVCGCGFPDVDSDGDSVLDCNDTCPNDPSKVEPGVCGCGVADVDSDGDGTLDCNDQCPSDPLKTVPGNCGCGVNETTVDSDGDGVYDCVDQCPGVADVDADGDGYATCIDHCDNDPNKLEPGSCGCGVPDTDTDGDTVPDCIDVCDYNPYLQYDTGDCGTCDQMYVICSNEIQGCYPFCYNDPLNYPDPCTCLLNKRNEFLPPPKHALLIKDVQQDLPPPLRNCTLDSDGDGVSDCFDACPANPDKHSDLGTCGCWSSMDDDTDGDGVPDCRDGCPNDPNKVKPLSCGCGVADTDSDGDGVDDCWDKCPNDPLKAYPSACGCNCLDADQGGDSDGDGVADCHDLTRDVNNKRSTLRSDPTAYCADCLDQCPNDPTKIVSGQCGCGVPDVDSDGDGIMDCTDLCPASSIKVSPGVCGCDKTDIDSDNDGTRDCLDLCPNDPLSTVPSSCGCGFDENQCDEFHRSDGTASGTDPVEPEPEPEPHGISGGTIALIVVSVALVAAAAVGATVLLMRHVRAARLRQTAIELEAARPKEPWQPATRWVNGQL